MAEIDHGESEVARTKASAALWSIVASVAITLGKGAAGFLTGSLALLSDAAHSLLDVVFTTMTYLVVKAADRPPDHDHPYGHGKIESLAALGQAALLFLLSGAVAFEGLRRLWSGHAEVAPSWLAVAVLMIAILVDAWRWRALSRIARETGSEALAADALHFSSDLVNSLLILAAFGAVMLGFAWADALVALGVSLFIAVGGMRLMRRTVGTLTDTAPVDLVSRLERRVGEVSGVVAVESVKLRRVGATELGEVGIRVSRLQAFERVAEIKARVLAAIAIEAPRARVTVSANPIQLDDESIRERLAALALKQRVPIHHVTVQRLGERLAIGCDVEFDGHMPLGEAHDLASRFESAVRQELGAEVEVETHIEPLEIDEFSGAPADAETHDIVAGVLRGLARQTGAIEDVHSVRVRRTAEGLVVNYHCRVDAARMVAAVHADVDRIEAGLKAQAPDIRRVIGHAEPLRPAPERRPD